MDRSYTMLALVPDAYGGRGGIAQYNRDFLGAIAQSGLVSSITVLPRHAPDPVEPPSGVRQVAPQRGRVFYSIAALRTALLRKIDLVFCGHIYMAPLAALIAGMKSAKLIIQTHGVEAWACPSRLQRLAVEQADLVLSVSRHTRAAVLGWATIVPERVLVVPNTVREMFTPGDGSNQLTNLGLEGKRILLTVGRMASDERYKGHDRVIAAIPELVKRGHDICYLIVGEGDDRPRLEGLAHQLGVSDQVRFLGPVESRTLPDFYRAADLFVMPSTGEGFGVSFLEAMASGTPALGLDVAGARDALGEGELGTAVSEDELAGAIGRLLERARPDPALAAAVLLRFSREKLNTAVRLAVNSLIEAA